MFCKSRSVYFALTKLYHVQNIDTDSRFESCRSKDLAEKGGVTSLDRIRGKIRRRLARLMFGILPRKQTLHATFSKPYA